MKDTPGGKVTGEPVMVVDGFQFLQADGQRLAINAVALVGLVILICFRSIRWVVIPLAVVGFSLYATKGVVAALGLRLTMVSSMFTSVVVVIAIATLVHVIVRFRELRSDKQSVSLALQSTLTALLGPIVWSCLTDAAGFGSLLVSRVAPVRDFGMMMAIASLTVPLGVYLIVPGLTLFGEFDTDPRKTWGENRLRAALHRPTVWLEKRPIFWLIGLAALAAFSAIGMLMLRIETDFTKNFRSDSDIVHDAEFVESRFSGAGIMDILLPVKGDVDKPFLQRVESLEADLSNLKFPQGQRATSRR